MDASTFFAIRLTEQRFREFDREVTLRRRLAEHFAARRADRAARRDRRAHALAA